MNTASGMTPQNGENAYDGMNAHGGKAGDGSQWPLTAASIAALLPHQGAMCLIDRVERCDAASISCLTDSHRRRPHPMADADGRLGIACGIEYAAQAMALHAALALLRAEAPAGADRPLRRLPMGMLVGLRGLTLRGKRLDQQAGSLHIEATLLGGDQRSALYAFRVSAADELLIEARATVMIDAGDALGTLGAHDDAPQPRASRAAP